MTKKILITGPESTGKSSLAKALADYYKAHLISEFAREYLQHIERPYTEDDLLMIAKEQMKKEDLVLGSASLLSIIDTDLTVMDIWSQEKFGRTHPWIIEEMQKRTYDLYLVPDIDLEWSFDSQRENPYDRDRLMKLYLRSFDQRKIKYHMVRGQGVERTQNAIEIIKRELKLTAKTQRC